MNGGQYVILAYAIGLGLIWGYALTLWVSHTKRPPAPCTQGEGRGEGAFPAAYGSQVHPLPNPSTSRSPRTVEYREREENADGGKS